MIEDTSENANNVDADGNIEILRKQHITRGISSYVNLGNTCYMAAALQCLSATDEFVSWFRGSGKSGKYKQYLKNAIIKSIVDEHKKNANGNKIVIDMKSVKKMFKDTLTYKLRNVLVVAWGKNCKIKPKSFKHKLGTLDHTYAGYAQNDSQECVNYILDRVHEETKTDVTIELRNIPDEIIEYKNKKDQYTQQITNIDEQSNNKLEIMNEYIKFRNDNLKEDACLKAIMYWQKFIKKNHSVIIDLFYGLYLSEIKCKECNNTNFIHEPYTSLSIQIPDKKNKISLYECLDETFNSEEIMTNDNKYDCDICVKKTDAVKKMSLWHCPPRLIFHLKRFINEPIVLSKTKHMRTIKKTECITFPIKELNLSKYMSTYVDNDCIYDLYAVIHQSGSLMGGHYVAYTKNPISGEWYLYDDANVVRIEKDKLESELNTSNAYILFYEKRSSINYANDISSDDEVDNNDDFDLT